MSLISFVRLKLKCWFCLLAQDDGLGNPRCPFFAFSRSRLEDARPNGRARECLPPFGCIENITLYLSYYVDDGHDLDPNFWACENARSHGFATVDDATLGHPLSANGHPKVRKD